MATVLAANWWALALRGVAAMLFGVVALLVPGVTLAAVVLLFGGYALVDGVFNVIAAFRGPGHDRPWWSLALEGVVSITAGVGALALPAITLVVLVYVVAAWALMTGALELGAAIRLRRELTGEWRMAMNGILSLVFGGLVMLAPALGALAMALWLGAYMLAFGALMLALALRVRALARDREGLPQPLRRAA
jgi:uncharacterized membrane protein HdeD (DUF308 family)